ncbi:MAG: FkbM family methyltransferase [Proteobacteria bacterium]|nr:FkbM family methyltransferase [Pseudomonadota bacterium]
MEPMKNPVSSTKAKYGQFIHFSNDDPIGACLAFYGEWAQQELDFFDTILTPQSSVIDVGANIGTHTVYFSQKCTDGNVLSIEPQLYIFEMLAANIIINACYNAVPVHAAAGKEAQKLKMVNINPFVTNAVNYGEFKVNSNPDRGVTTNMVTLDEYAYFDNIDLVKIDVEGFEHDVLSGASELLTIHKPNLYIEFNDRKGNPSLLEYIYSLDYIPYWHIYTKHNPNNFRGMERNIWEPPGYVADSVNLDKRYEGNVFCVHKSKQQPVDMRKAAVTDSITKLLFEQALI